MSYQYSGYDRVAVVTGSDSGIAEAIAVALASAGFDVGVTYRSDKAGRRVRDLDRRVSASPRSSAGCVPSMSTPCALTWISSAAPRVRPRTPARSAGASRLVATHACTCTTSAADGYLRADDVLEALDGSDPRGVSVFLCGPRPMVDAFARRWRAERQHSP